MQYYSHKLEYADKNDMFGIVNSLIKPTTESLPYLFQLKNVADSFI